MCRAHIVGKSAKPQRADLATQENARISVIRQENRCESQRIRGPANSGLQVLENRPPEEAVLARPGNPGPQGANGASRNGDRN